jgi:hypothetical protein
MKDFIITRFTIYSIPITPIDTQAKVMISFLLLGLWFVSECLVKPSLIKYGPPALEK